jgi:hypothetical protein
MVLYYSPGYLCTVWVQLSWWLVRIRHLYRTIKGTFQTMVFSKDSVSRNYLLCRPVNSNYILGRPVKSNYILCRPVNSNYILCRPVNSNYILGRPANKN